MIDSLTTLFKTIKPVKRAFLCSIKESADEKPVLLIGIEADGDIDEIIRAAGSVATDTLPGDEPIDICQVKKGEKGSATLLPSTSPRSTSVAGAASCAISRPTALSDYSGVIFTPLLPAAVNPSAAPDSTQTMLPLRLRLRNVPLRHRGQNASAIPQRIGRRAGKRDDRHADVFGDPRFIQYLLRFAAA